MNASTTSLPHSRLQSEQLESLLRMRHALRALTRTGQSSATNTNAAHENGPTAVPLSPRSTSAFAPVGSAQAAAVSNSANPIAQNLRLGPETAAAWPVTRFEQPLPSQVTTPQAGRPSTSLSRLAAIRRDSRAATAQQQQADVVAQSISVVTTSRQQPTRHRHSATEPAAGCMAARPPLRHSTSRAALLPLLVAPLAPIAAAATIATAPTASAVTVTAQRMHASEQLTAGPIHELPAAVGGHADAVAHGVRRSFGTVHASAGTSSGTTRLIPSRSAAATVVRVGGGYLLSAPPVTQPHRHTHRCGHSRYRTSGRQHAQHRLDAPSITSTVRTNPGRQGLHSSSSSSSSSWWQTLGLPPMSAGRHRPDRLVSSPAGLHPQPQAEAANHNGVSSPQAAIRSSSSSRPSTAAGLLQQHPQQHAATAGAASNIIPAGVGGSRNAPTQQDATALVSTRPQAPEALVSVTGITHHLTTQPQQIGSPANYNSTSSSSSSSLGEPAIMALPSEHRYLPMSSIQHSAPAGTAGSAGPTQPARLVAPAVPLAGHVHNPARLASGSADAVRLSQPVRGMTSHSSGHQLVAAAAGTAPATPAPTMMTAAVAAATAAPQPAAPLHRGPTPDLALVSDPVSTDTASSGVLSLQELLEALREGYSPLPTSPRLPSPLTITAAVADPSSVVLLMPPGSRPDNTGSSPTGTAAVSRAVMPATAAAAAAEVADAGEPVTDHQVVQHRVMQLLVPEPLGEADQLQNTPAAAAEAADGAAEALTHRHTGALHALAVLSEPTAAGLPVLHRHSAHDQGAPQSVVTVAAAAAAAAQAPDDSVHAASRTQMQTGTAVELASLRPGQPACAQLGGAVAAPSSSNSSTAVPQMAAASDDPDVLMAIQLLTDSLHTLRDTHALIDSILALDREVAGGLPSYRDYTTSEASNINHGISSVIVQSDGNSNTSGQDTAGSSSSSSSGDRSNLSSTPVSSTSSSTSNETSSSQLTCVVFMVAPRSVLLLPCKHLILCSSCFSRMSADAAARHAPLASAAATAERFFADINEDDDSLLQHLLQPGHQHSAPTNTDRGSVSLGAQRRRSPRREWLGPIPVGALLPGLVDYHWWQQPAAQMGVHQGSLGLVGEADRMVRHDRLRYGALVRCPICRRAVEQSVSGVLVV